MIPILLTALVIFGLPTLYFAVRSRDFRKFLAGAFFVSSGMQFYFYFTHIPMLVMGTTHVQTPAMSGVRACIHFIGFLLTLYYGFIKKPRDSGKLQG